MIRILTLVCILVAAGRTSLPAHELHRFLVVFSYEEDSLWEGEIRDAIERTLSPVADLTFFYLNTKTRLEGGQDRAAAAYELYLDLQPDGVIAVDDNAQSLFVVPYLKDREPVPVIFCGVNADPEEYGYPATNVTGILERHHFEETIALSRQFGGRVETFAVMVENSPSAGLIIDQLMKQQEQLSAELVGVLMPDDLDDAVGKAKRYRTMADLLFVLTLNGLTGKDGRRVDEKQAIARVVAAFAKPTAATAAFAIKSGVLNGVLASGEEQGMRASFMMMEALREHGVEMIPVDRNRLGKRMVNVSTMKALGLNPDPIFYRGVEFVRSE